MRAKFRVLIHNFFPSTHIALCRRTTIFKLISLRLCSLSASFSSFLSVRAAQRSTLLQRFLDFCFFAARLGMIEQLQAAEAESAAHERDAGETSFPHFIFPRCQTYWSRFSPILRAFLSIVGTLILNFCFVHST